jgi:hypothetical protein
LDDGKILAMVTHINSTLENIELSINTIESTITNIGDMQRKDRMGKLERKIARLERETNE